MLSILLLKAIFVMLLHLTSGIMTSPESLMKAYNDATVGIKGRFGYCVITNPDAKVGGVMLVGINPSGHGSDDIIVDYRKCKSRAEGGWGDPASFWGPKHRMMGKYDRYAAYVDLLPIRMTHQHEVDNLNPAFRARLLEVTQKHIEEMKPRLIILVNQSALYYWGSNEDATWMGYRLGQPVKQLKGKWNLYRIQGLKTEKRDRINQEYFIDKGNITQLEGCYLLHYCQASVRRNYPISGLQINEPDIAELLKGIDPKWEQTLY